MRTSGTALHGLCVCFGSVQLELVDSEVVTLFNHSILDSRTTQIICQRMTILLSRISSRRVMCYEELFWYSIKALHGYVTCTYHISIFNVRCILANFSHFFPKINSAEDAFLLHPTNQLIQHFYLHQTC